MLWFSPKTLPPAPVEFELVLAAGFQLARGTHADADPRWVEVARLRAPRRHARRASATLSFVEGGAGGGVGLAGAATACERPFPYSARFLADLGSVAQRPAAVTAWFEAMAGASGDARDARKGNPEVGGGPTPLRTVCASLPAPATAHESSLKQVLVRAEHPGELARATASLARCFGDGLRLEAGDAALDRVQAFLRSLEEENRARQLWLGREEQAATDGPAMRTHALASMRRQASTDAAAARLWDFDERAGT